MCTPYGTKIADAVAPVSFTASATLAKTGLPRCCSPAFLGFVPPTTLVPCCTLVALSAYQLQSVTQASIPYSMACCAWNLGTN